MRDLLGAQPPNDFQPQVPDLLAQGIAVEAQQLRRPDLVAAGGGQADGDQRPLHLLHDAVIDARRRQPVALGEEILGQILLHRRAPAIAVLVGIRREGPGRLLQFAR